MRADLVLHASSQCLTRLDGEVRKRVSESIVRTTTLGRAADFDFGIHCSYRDMQDFFLEFPIYIGVGVLLVLSF